MAENPAVEKIVVEIIDKFIVQPIKHQCDYICFFKRNVDLLDVEHINLRAARNDVMSRINAATNNAEEISCRVQTWLDRANEKLTEGETISNTNNCCLCLKSRYSLSKRAVKAAEAMKELREECPKHDETITVPPGPLAAEADRLARPIVEFDSRKGIEEEVMGLLRDGGVKIIGIYGMGGVGKTTLAKKIKNRVLNDKEFDESLMVVVSQNPEMVRIQGDIVEKLGLELKEKELLSRAEILCKRLIGGKRILIILDDVWEPLKLDELGIPVSGRCTVLLTSRDINVLHRMGAQKPIPEMKILSEEEAWSFFKEKLGGISGDDPTWLSSKAQEIAKVCKCLPLALEIVAEAMKTKKEGRDKACWDDALRGLRRGQTDDVEDVRKSVYIPLKLSYDFLSSENAKSLFLLCCLFREDSRISLETLTCFAMGLRTFGDQFENLAQVRDKTYSLIRTLKDRSLILEGSDGKCVGMHDVVRDVAIFIASNRLNIGNDSEWISPYCGETNIDFFGGSTFPNLRLLIIDGSDRVYRDLELQTYNDSFSGMIEHKQLNVLCYYYSFESLPSSTGLLKDLRTLIIESCRNLKSIGIVGQLAKLEVLICRDCSMIVEFSWDTQELNCMRLLEIRGCYNMRKIGRGVISSVNKLEELMIVHSFKEWDEEGLREIEGLRNLRRLEIEVTNYNLAAQLITLPQAPNISKFHIIIGDQVFHYDELEFERTLTLNCDSEINLGTWIQTSLIRNVECLFLDGHVPNDCLLPIITRGSDCFHQLKKLHIEYCEKLEYVFSEENENIITGLQSHGSIHQFPLLTEIIIWCKQMKGLISSFQGSEDRVYEDDHSSHFFCKMELSYLPRLTSFYEGIKSIKFPMLHDMSIEDCPELKGIKLGGDDHHQSSHLFCHHQVSFSNNWRRLVVQGNASFTIFTNLFCPQIDFHSFTKLIEELYINSFQKMKNLFSVLVAQNLVNLHTLGIKNCKEMMQVIGGDEDNIIGQDGSIAVFPNLKQLKLISLPRLTSVYKGNGNIKFPMLHQLEIENCPQLYRAVSSIEDITIAHRYHLSQVSFSNLKELTLNDDAGSQIIFWPQFPEDLFIRLEKLRIERCDGITSLFSCSTAANLINLRKLFIRGCGKMASVIEEENEYSSHDNLFPKLNDLYLWDLRELKRFSGCGLNMASLEEVRIENCPNMEIFNLGSLTTPNLKGVRMNNHLTYIEGENGLNDVVSARYFPGDENIMLMASRMNSSGSEDDDDDEEN